MRWYSRRRRRRCRVRVRIRIRFRFRVRVRVREVMNFETIESILATCLFVLPCPALPCLALWFSCLVFVLFYLVAIFILSCGSLVLIL